MVRPQKKNVELGEALRNGGVTGDGAVDFKVCRGRQEWRWCCSASRYRIYGDAVLSLWLQVEMSCFLESEHCDNDHVLVSVVKEKRFDSKPLQHDGRAGI
jgi:hypothetical protein